MLTFIGMGIELKLKSEVVLGGHWGGGGGVYYLEKNHDFSEGVAL